MEHVKFLVNKHNIDILGLSETNLHRSVEKLEIKIENYKIFCQDLNMSRIITYVKDDLECKLAEEMMDPEFSCIWLEVGRGRTKWLIGQIYRLDQLKV